MATLESEAVVVYEGGRRPAASPAVTPGPSIADLTSALGARGERVPDVAAQARVGVSQSSWGLAIAAYLFLVGVGAGSFFTATVLDWSGFGLEPSYLTLIDGWSWDWTQAFVLWGPAAAALGASTHLLHAGKNRFLFYTAGKNPRTSWMARGFSILSTFILVGGLVALGSVVVPEATTEYALPWRALQAIAALAALIMAIYPGMFLRSMPAMPAWNTRLLPGLLTVAAFMTGSLALVVGATLCSFLAGDSAVAADMLRALGLLVPLLIVAEAAVLGMYVRELRGNAKPEALQAATTWLSGAWRRRFWIGIVGGALVVPLALTLVSLGGAAEGLLLAAALCGLLGGFLVPTGVLAIGIKETPPLVRLSRWRQLATSGDLPATADSEGRAG